MPTPPKTQTTLSQWLSLAEAATYARVSQKTITRWIRRGLRHSRPGGGRTVLVNALDLDAFLRDQAEHPQESDSVANDRR